MQLTIVPLSQCDQMSSLTDHSKKDFLKTVEHMEEEIERLKESTLSLDRAKKIILTERIEGMKMALLLTGHTLMYR